MREQLLRTEAKELGCFLAQQDNRVCVKTIKKELNIRQRRRLELIKNNDWEILYHSGKANVVADALSKKERLKMIMSLGEFIRDFGNSSEGKAKEVADTLKDEVVERKMLRPVVVQRTKDIIDLIRGRLVVAQDRNTKYVDLTRKDKE
ncbi:hypothetical protein AgCh_013576 [Apium graveolens]